MAESVMLLKRTMDPQNGIEYQNRSKQLWRFHIGEKQNISIPKICFFNNDFGTIAFLYEK